MPEVYDEGRANRPNERSASKSEALHGKALIFDRIPAVYHPELHSLVSDIKDLKVRLSKASVLSVRQELLKASVDIMRSLKTVTDEPEDFIRSREALDNLHSLSPRIASKAAETLSAMPQFLFGRARNYLLGTNSCTGIKSDDERERELSVRALHGTKDEEIAKALIDAYSWEVSSEIESLMLLALYRIDAPVILELLEDQEILKDYAALPFLKEFEAEVIGSTNVAEHLWEIICDANKPNWVTEDAFDALSYRVKKSPTLEPFGSLPEQLLNKMEDYIDYSLNQFSFNLLLCYVEKGFNADGCEREIVNQLLYEELPKDLATKASQHIEPEYALKLVKGWLEEESTCSNLDVFLRRAGALSYEKLAPVCKEILDQKDRIHAREAAFELYYAPLNANPSSLGRSELSRHTRDLKDLVTRGVSKNEVSAAAKLLLKLSDKNLKWLLWKLSDLELSPTTFHGIYLGVREIDNPEIPLAVAENFGRTCYWGLDAIARDSIKNYLKESLSPRLERKLRSILNWSSAKGGRLLAIVDILSESDDPKNQRAIFRRFKRNRCYNIALYLALSLRNVSDSQVIRQARRMAKDFALGSDDSKASGAALILAYHSAKDGLDIISHRFQNASSRENVFVKDIYQAISSGLAMEPDQKVLDRILESARLSKSESLQDHLYEMLKGVEHETALLALLELSTKNRQLPATCAASEAAKLLKKPEFEDYRAEALELFSRNLFKEVRDIGARLEAELKKEELRP